MTNRIPKEYIAQIAKASTYFAFKNGPIKELIKNNKISEEDLKSIQRYMDDHLAYLYTVLLEENNIKKFDLIVNTMNKFYVNDTEDVVINDDGFDKFYDSLFPKTNNITVK
ncbi:Uncharacterised protein [uncultured Clostridium sp.]|uniref:hypothetical protein n=1 Tax=uncultured Clostridium sp. TaxID=59620 RepID=UPI0008231E9F|nr:hypothetical protein [uncultured Clostridium sp.]SCK03007.1 Uncharacterised protein [uncultured Clostridium sp.]